MSRTNPRSLVRGHRRSRTLQPAIDLKKKVILVGDEKTGKSTILMALFKQPIDLNYVPTIMNVYRHRMMVKNHHLRLRIVDTSGQEQNSRILSSAYDNARLIILTFAIDNRESFANINEKWHPEIIFYTENIPFILVGTKAELRSTSNSDVKLVTFKEGRTLAKKLGAASYIECSAITNCNIEKLFEEVSQLLIGGGAAKSFSPRPCTIN